MRKFVFLVISIFILLFFSGCKNETSPVSISKNSPHPIEQKSLPETSDTIEESVEVEDSRVMAPEWIKKWMNDVYGDYGVTDIKVTHISSGYFDQFSNSIQICPMLYSVEYISQKTIKGSIQNTNGASLIKIMIVTVQENNRVVLSGFLGPDEFDENNALPSVYDVVSKDKRYSSKLKAFPKVNIPPVFNKIDLSTITGGLSNRDIRVFPNGVIAVVCDEPIHETDRVCLKVILYDLNSDTIINQLDIGEYTLNSLLIVDDVLILKVNNYDRSQMFAFNIKSSGEMTKEEYPKGIDQVLYSPDRSKYAFTKDSSLYVIDTKDEGEAKLLLKGNPSSLDDSIYYYPFSWLDDSTLLYGIWAYECSFGCGQIDVVTGKDTFYEQAGRLAQPCRIINGKLYTIIGEAGARFDPLAMDLTDNKFSTKKIFEDRNFIENIFAEGYAFSPDGSKLALLKAAQNLNENNALYICSAEDGSIIKSYEFKSPFSIPQHVYFLEDGRLVIFAERYAYSNALLYIVNPEQLYKI